MARSPDPADRDALVRRAASGDQASQERLVEAFLPTIERMAAARGEQPGLPLGHLVQEGSLGLVKATRTFHAGGEAAFQRFAELQTAAQHTAGVAGYTGAAARGQM